jgi:putative oxidoreductase
MFKGILEDKYLVLVFRIILGLVFVYASMDKISHPAQFAQIVHNYRILPSFTINLFAICLPWVELIAGLFLIGGIFIESTAVLLGFLLVIFSIAISINVFFRGLDLNCGCFTTSLSAKKEGANLLFRDLILLGMGLQIFFFNQNKYTLPGFYRKLFSRLLSK